MTIEERALALVKKARQICADHDANKAYQYLDGSRDDYPEMRMVRAALMAENAGLVAEIERLREAVGILEDGLQEVGDDYPGSSCREWCQHQIKQARAALKDTRNDNG